MHELKTIRIIGLIAIIVCVILICYQTTLAHQTDRREVVCPDCRGTGFVGCTVCSGTGLQNNIDIKQKDNYYGGIFEICTNCSGSGVKSCPTCNGTGKIRAK